MELPENSSQCGYVGLLGRPNAGKSTLLNHLLRQKVSIVSDKPQTTRNRVLGILTQGTSQIIFVDTPGIHRPGYRLNARMMEIVYEAIRGVDVLIHLVDVSERFGKGERFAVDLIAGARQPALLALNKVDKVNKGKILPAIESYAAFDVYREIIPVSATEGDNLEVLLQKVIELLPANEFQHHADQVTDQTERFLAAEVIREKVLRRTRKELPYATAVQVEQFDETRRKEGFVRIVASIVVDRPSQKKIVIGRGGRMIKQIGIAARREIERRLEIRQIYLDLHVRVVGGWRNVDRWLDELGVR